VWSVILRRTLDLAVDLWSLEPLRSHLVFTQKLLAPRRSRIRSDTLIPQQRIATPLRARGDRVFGVPDGGTEKEPSLDEINAKLPREVSLSYDGRSSLWVILICLIGGLIWLGGVSCYIVHQRQQHDALDREGLDAPAQVTRIGHGRGSDTFYYTFQVAGVDYRSDASSTGATEYPNVGSQIQVLYLPSDPSVNYPKGWGWWDFGYLFLFYFGALPVYGGARTAWSLYRDWRLARLGWVTEGKVTICVPKKNTGKFMVDYEFRTQNDELIEGSNNNCDDEYKTDSKIKVIYLRHQPKRNDSSPLNSYRMVEHKSPADLFMANR
jgi:hypothetical protein